MNNKTHKQQHGAALLVLFLVLLAASTALVLTALKNQAPHLRQENDIHKEMVKTKEALLAYTTIYSDTSAGPGRFPCTDFSNNGEEICGDTGARLPESLTLPSSGKPFLLNKAYTDIDRQFWYFISPNFVRSTAGDVNTDTNSTFTLDGITDIVAVIIAPGEALAWQNRESGSTSSINYIEAGNKDGNDFINNYPVDPDNFNDHVLGISKTEVMTLITSKVAKEIKEQIDALHEVPGYDTYPRATPANFGYPGSPAYTEYNWFTYAMEFMGGEPDWYTGDSWNSSIENYTSLSDDSATLKFSNCDITYTLEYPSGFSRSQASC